MSPLCSVPEETVLEGGRTELSGGSSSPRRKRRAAPSRGPSRTMGRSAVGETVCERYWTGCLEASQVLQGSCVVNPASAHRAAINSICIRLYKAVRCAHEVTVW